MQRQLFNNTQTSEPTIQAQTNGVAVARSDKRNPRSPARAYLQLLRPANLVTAAADVLAGCAVASGATAWSGANAASLVLLVLASVGLYGGGVVLNDVFDRDLDAVERPERPLPRGDASVAGAVTLGVLLLLGAVVLAFTVSKVSGVIALFIVAGVLLYDTWAKHRALAATLVLGACRGLNLLLGVSLAAGAVGAHWPLALVPLCYIAAVTLLSRGEVHGGTRRTATLSLVLLGAALLGLVGYSWRAGWSLLALLPFAALLAWRVLPPFWRAFETNQAPDIRRAVKAGVLSLIVLDACIAAASAGVVAGLLVLLLLALAAFLARRFAVT